MKKVLFVAVLACAAIFITSCGAQEGMKMGSLSKMDSLSYMLGANVGYGVGYEAADIPIDFEAFEKGFNDGALDKIAKERKEEVGNAVRDFFMMKRYERAQAIDAARKEQDSVRMAAGDTTKMEYPQPDPTMFESETERAEISYGYGWQIGENLRNSGLSLHLVWLSKGMKDIRDGAATVSEDEVNNYLQNYFMVVLPERNAKESTEWLTKIEKKSGVKKTESGLLYKVIKKGDEKIIPTANDVVKVKYTGRTREGKVFDSSIFKNRPKDQQEAIKQYDPENYGIDKDLEIPLRGVIRGWTEGLQLIGQGGKIMLWIPSDLAYGQRGPGRPGLIGPNDALEFEIELVEVVAPKETPQTTELPADVEEVEEIEIVK